jgi:hypothetical protein
MPRFDPDLSRPAACLRAGGRLFGRPAARLSGGRAFSGCPTRTLNRLTAGWR